MSKHRYIYLSSEERAKLVKLLRTGRSAARRQMRARVLLLSDRSQGELRTGQEVADGAMCSLGTVRRVCTRYHDEGLDAALSDKGWPGAKPKLNGVILHATLRNGIAAKPHHAFAAKVRQFRDRVEVVQFGCKWGICGQATPGYGMTPVGSIDSWSLSKAKTGRRGCQAGEKRIWTYVPYCTTSNKERATGRRLRR